MIVIDPIKVKETGLELNCIILGLFLDHKRMIFEKVESLKSLSEDLNMPNSAVSKAYKTLEISGLAVKIGKEYTTTPEWIEMYYGGSNNTNTDRSLEMAQYVYDLICEYTGQPKKKVPKSQHKIIRDIMIRDTECVGDKDAFETKKIQFTYILGAHKHWLDDDMAKYYNINSMLGTMAKCHNKLETARTFYRSNVNKSK